MTRRMKRPEQPAARRRRSAAVLAVVSMTSAVLLWAGGAPAVAAEVGAVDAGGQLVVSGQGYGHGRGMSQWGAQGAGLAGLSHQDILAFYYPGSSLQRAPQRPIRVKLTAEDADLVIAADAAVRVTDQATGVVLDWRGLGDKARVLMANDGFLRVQHLSGGAWRTATNPAWPGDRVAGPVTISGPDSLWVEGSNGTERSYRGTLSVIRSGSTVKVVNTLDLERYLYGVVPREMPSWFTPAALRAQAVAARSYAVRPCNGGDPDYDVLDTISCQVYGGRAQRSGGKETNLETANAAVDATAATVLTRDGAVLRTEFSASNGGRIVASNGWPAKDDPYDGADARNTGHRWQATVTAAQLGATAGVGPVRQVRVLNRVGGGTWGGRAGQVEIVGASGVAVLTGAQVRASLGLKSDWFSFQGGPRAAGLVLSVTPGNPVTLTEVNAGASAASRGAIRTASLAVENSSDWFFASWGQGEHPDLVSVKLRNTGSGRVEVHTLSGTADYSAFTVHAATPLPQLDGNPGWQFAVGSYAGSAQPDLFAFRTGPSASGRTEVHVLSAASGYQAWVAHTATALPPLDDRSVSLLVGDAGDSGDVSAVVRTGTQSGRTEVHRLTRASGYNQFDQHVATALHEAVPEDFGLQLGEYDQDGVPDLYALKRRSTPSGALEVHVMDGSSGYGTWQVHTETDVALTPGSALTVRLR